MEAEDRVPRKAKRATNDTVQHQEQPRKNESEEETETKEEPAFTPKVMDLSQNLMDSIPRKEKQDEGQDAAPGTRDAGELDYEWPLDLASTWPANTLSSSRTQELERALTTDPWDGDAWLALVDEAHRRPMKEAQAVYERALHQFPTSARIWKLYLEHLIREERFPDAEKRFSYALPRCYSVELCQLYLHYLHAVKKVPISVLIDAYEYVTTMLSYELTCSSLWNDYITLLKTVPIRNAHDEAQRNRLLRSVFQRAVTLPINNLDTLWRQFEQFEASASRGGSGNASAATQPFHAAYIRARTEARARRARRERLHLSALAVPPRRGKKIMEQAKLWAKYMRAEESNLQELGKAEHEMRLRFAYEQRLVYMYRMPDAWLEYALYLAHRDDVDIILSYPEATAVLERAERALSDCPLVYFALARLYEELDTQAARIAGQQQRKREYLREELEKVGGSRLQNEDEMDDTGNDSFDDARTSQGDKLKSHSAAADSKQRIANGIRQAAEPAETDASKNAPLDAAEAVPLPSSAETLSNEKALALSETMAARAAAVYERLVQRERLSAVQRIHAYIEYMWFARRTMGIAAARTVFRRARHDPHCADVDALPNLYLAAASLETFCNHEEGVAKRIFELGLRHLPDSTEMAVCYFDFLWQRNDRGELRLLIGRLLQTTLPDEAKLLLCDRWLSFEARYGTAGLHGLRLAEAERKNLFSEHQPSRLEDLLLYTSFWQCVALNDDEWAVFEQNRSSDTGTEPYMLHQIGIVPGGVTPSSGLRYRLASGVTFQEQVALAPSESTTVALEREQRPQSRHARKEAPTEQASEKLSLEEGLARLVGNLSPALLQTVPPNPDFVLRHLLRLPPRFLDLALFHGGSKDEDADQGSKRALREHERTFRLGSGDQRPGHAESFLESQLFRRLQRARQAPNRAPRPESTGSTLAHISMQAPPPTRDIYRSRHRG
jgi:cleavage stimulation factor subunit 3